MGLALGVYIRAAGLLIHESCSDTPELLVSSMHGDAAARHTDCGSLDLQI